MAEELNTPYMQLLLESSILVAVEIKDPVPSLQALAQRWMQALRDDPERESVRATPQLMTRDSTAQGIQARQRDEMNAILYNFWERLDGLPPSRPEPPSIYEVHEADRYLRSHLPHTPEQIAEVERTASKITADPEKRRIIDRVTGGVKRADVAGLTPWALLVLVMWLLLRIADEPGTKASNDLTVIAIVVAMAAVILSRK